jgi:hypothetical protein
MATVILHMSEVNNALACIHVVLFEYLLEAQQHVQAKAYVPDRENISASQNACVELREV